jgi:tetratricopeptide (TPR) repeat protein
LAALICAYSRLLIKSDANYIFSHVSTQGLDIVIDKLEPKINTLVDMVLSMDPYANDRGSNEIHDVNVSRVKAVAQKVISSARSVVGSGSSVVSYEDLGRDKRDRISKWNLDTVQEVTPGPADSEDMKVNSSSEDEDDLQLQLEVFANMVKEGQRHFEGGLGKAEGFYLESVRAVTGIGLRGEHALLYNEVHLKLAQIYVQEKNFDKAKQILLQLLSKSALGLPAAEAEQLVEGTHKISEVHLHLKELEDAERCCKQAMKARMRTQGRDSPAFIESVTLLIAIYEAKGNNELAAGHLSLILKPKNTPNANVDPEKRGDTFAKYSSQDRTALEEAGDSSQQKPSKPQDRSRQGPPVLSTIPNSQKDLSLQDPLSRSWIRMPFSDLRSMPRYAS